MSKDIDEAMMKRRHSIPIPSDSNLVTIDDIISPPQPPSRPSATSKANFDKPKDGNDNEKQTQIIIPIYWHIPRSGGRMISNLLGQCLGLTLASSSSLYVPSTLPSGLATESTSTSTPLLPLP